MVKIASHHRPGHPLAKDSDYTPVCLWPDDCCVQWDGGGVVIGREGSYRTAFFEAFPSDNSGGFIRGEGETIEAAEGDAYRRWQKERACDHAWSRQPRKKDGTAGSLYTNGGGVCWKCGAFKTVFKPLVELGSYRKPLSASEIACITSGYLIPMRDGDEGADSAKYHRRIELRAKLCGIVLPAKPAAYLDYRSDERKAYEEACMSAVVDYYIVHRARLLNGGDEALLSSFLRSFALSGVERALKDRGIKPTDPSTMNQSPNS